MAGNSYLDSLWNKVKQYAPTRQGINSAGEAILHAPFDAAGAIGDTLTKPITDIPSELRSLHALLTGHMVAANQELIKRAKSTGIVSPVAQRLHDIIHTDTAAPTTPVQKYVDTAIRGGPGGVTSQVAQDTLPDSRYKSALVDAAGLAGTLALPLAVGKFARGAPEELTTGTDIVPSKGPAGPTDGSAPVGSFGSQREAAQYMADNKLGGSHEIVAHGDGSYSAVPREGTISTPADVPETPQASPVEAETPSATQPTPAPQEAPQPPSDEQQQATQLTTAEPTAPIAPDGLPGNGSVRPIDLAMMARIMNDPGAIGQAPITTPAPDGDTTPVAPSITTSEKAHTPAPVSAPENNFMEPTVSPSGNYTHEVTADTPVNQAIYSEYKAHPDAEPIKAGLLINKADGKTTVNINTAKMDAAKDVANSTGPTAMRNMLIETLQAHPEINEITGIRKTGAGGSSEITQGLSAAQVSRIRARTTTKQPVDISDRHIDNLNPTIVDPAKENWQPPIDHMITRYSPTTQLPNGRAPANDTNRIDAAKNFVKNIAADERGSLGYKETPDDPKASDGDPVVQKMTDTLKDMAPLRKETSKQISQERSDRIAQAMKAMYANEGEEALHGALGALKGDMPKAIIPSIRDQFTEEEVTHLFNLVKNSNRVSGYEKINTMRALQKVLGEHYGEVPTEGELKLLAQVFPKDLIDAIQSHSLLEKVAGHATNILGIPRAVKTIGDLGVAFRQCSPLIGTKEFWKSFPSMFKGIASENLYHATFEAIKQMDTYPQMVEGKVAFTNMDSKLTEREEFAASKIAEHIPGVRQSERGFTGYLNTVRALTFDRLYKKAVEKGANVDDPEVLKEIGNFVNILSGRGSLGDIGDKASPFLAAAFFSPRLQWSRLQLLTMPFNPKFYRMPGYLQKEYMRSVISYGLYIAFALGVLQHVFGAKVSNDPRSTDYGRAVIGKTRFDVSGSFQPYVRTVAQVATGEKITAAGKKEELGKGFGTPTRLDTLWSFAQSKASPNVDVILNELRGKDWEHPKSITGQEMDWKDPSMNNPAVDALIPMGIEAMMKAGDVYGYKSPLPYVAGAAETGGITANTYADQKAHGHHGFKGFGSGSGFGKSFKGFK